MTPTGSWAKFVVPTSNFPLAITAGPDGVLWFTANSAVGSISTVYRISVYGKDLYEFPLGGTGVAATGITVGPDGNIWAANATGNSLARLASIYTLTAATTGTGGGSIISSPSGINCKSDCTEDYDHGTGVSLTATAATGSTFTGWTNACSGTAACLLTMNANAKVGAKFLANADLYLGMTASPNPVSVGSPLTYTLSAGNNGPYASYARVTDYLPVGRRTTQWRPRWAVVRSQPTAEVTSR
jgi:hypothetical protein